MWCAAQGEPHCPQPLQWDRLDLTFLPLQVGFNRSPALPLPGPRGIWVWVLCWERGTAGSMAQPGALPMQGGHQPGMTRQKGCCPPRQEQPEGIKLGEPRGHPPWGSLHQALHSMGLPHCGAFVSEKWLVSAATGTQPLGQRRGRVPAKGCQGADTGGRSWAWRSCLRHCHMFVISTAGRAAREPRGCNSP